MPIPCSLSTLIILKRTKKFVPCLMHSEHTKWTNRNPSLSLYTIIMTAVSTIDVFIVLTSYRINKHEQLNMSKNENTNYSLAGDRATAFYNAPEYNNVSML